MSEKQRSVVENRTKLALQAIDRLGKTQGADLADVELVQICDALGEAIERARENLRSRQVGFALGQSGE